MLYFEIHFFSLSIISFCSWTIELILIIKAGIHYLDRESCFLSDICKEKNLKFIRIWFNYNWNFECFGLCRDRIPFIVIQNAGGV